MVLGCLAAFWCLVVVLGAANPGYSQTRDYVSPLAAHGANFGWLGVLAICAAAIAMLGTALLLRPVSGVAALLAGLAGVGFLVVAFTRLDCPDGPAGCGLGGCFEVSGLQDRALDGNDGLGRALIAAMAWSRANLMRIGAHARDRSWARRLRQSVALGVGADRAQLLREVPALAAEPDAGLQALDRACELEGSLLACGQLRARRRAVRRPVPGSLVSCATRFSTAGLSTCPHFS
jgi:hypothetical protein